MSMIEMDTLGQVEARVSIKHGFSAGYLQGTEVPCLGMVCGGTVGKGAVERRAGAR